MAIKIGKPKQQILSDKEWQEKIGSKLPIEEEDFESDDDDNNLDDLEFSAGDFAFQENTSSENSIIKPSVSAKDTLIKLLRESQFDEPYMIELSMSYKEAKNFIHCMRVELSRFRNKLIKLNKTLDRFSILTKSITMQSDNHCIITLIKTRHRRRFDTADPEVLSVLEFLESNDNGK